MWTNNGIITVVTGSRYVDGQNTQFVGPVIAGYALLTADLRLYEIEAVESATRLRLVRPYQGGGAANVAYDVVPVSPDVTGLIERINALIDRYQSFRDGVGQGLFPDGSMAAPAMRFSADQDTGFARYGPNLLSVVTGGVERMRFGETNSSTASFVAVDGATCQRSGDASSLVVPLSIYGAIGGTATMRIRFGSGANQYAGHSFIEAQTLTASASDLRFGVSGVEAGRFDSAGNFLVGVASGGNHRIVKSVGEGITVLSIGGANTEFIYLNSVTTQGWSNAATAISVGRHSGNGRSVNAGGTINANGADYAEYMPKAAGCGIIAKGDVCGVDREGRLTKTWADAISFVVKSTDPSLVGGDTWASHLPPRPEQEEDETDEAFAARADKWSAELEQARLCVDRIAFCGQVPCNVAGDFEVGDYIVAAASGAGIKAVAVKLDDMTLAQYARRIGKVWAIRDGRAWIDVQHG